MLDTGLDLRHPDFRESDKFSSPLSQAKLRRKTVTATVNHTTGTACGPKGPTGVPRYGVAFGSQICVGKVLASSGGGTTATVLAGMNWAIANRCEVISMSVGADGVPPQVSYTQAGQAALDAGCLLYAAAGNASRRPGYIAPTGSPGNSPTIFSIAAVDANFRSRSSRQAEKSGSRGRVVDVFSSWPMPQGHRMNSGSERGHPACCGRGRLVGTIQCCSPGQGTRERPPADAKALAYPATDVGSGLVQCP